MAGSLCYLMYSESEIRVLFGFLAFWLSHGRITVLFDVFGVGDTRVVGFLAFWLSRDRIAMLFDVFGVGDTCVVGFPSFLAQSWQDHCVI